MYGQERQYPVHMYAWSGCELPHIWDHGYTPSPYFMLLAEASWLATSMSHSSSLLIEIYN